VVSELEQTQELVQLQAIGVNPLERAVFDAMSPSVSLSEAGRIMESYISHIARRAVVDHD